ncbi:MAG: protein arginine kinase [Oscillospiraceae bacterium]|nr:protein arginine kinase [Oscillospiraceae bacterium]
MNTNTDNINNTETEVEKILDGGNLTLGPDCDIAISSRVRIARNLSDFPFPAKLNSSGRKKVIEAVNSAIKNIDNINNKGKNSYEFIDFSKLSSAETGALMEKRVISLDFIKSPEEKELIADINDGLYVMVNEEDHLRIQSIKPGFAIYEAYGEANKFDSLTDENLSYAYDENFGYLTQCPTNLGTGMRVSVMLHLPALTLNRKVQNITADLSKIGLTIRGFYGEGTEVGGDLYQISNNITLGISEEQTLDKIRTVAEKIIELERTGRNEIFRTSKDLITDKIKRAYGIIKNAYMISSSEFLSLYSMIRLGITYGVIKDIDYKTLDMLLVKVMPANLILQFKDSETNRDILRAQYIKEVLG